jgi:hypothetical protein
MRLAARFNNVFDKFSSGESQLKYEVLVMNVEVVAYLKGDSILSCDSYLICVKTAYATFLLDTVDIVACFLHD